MCPCNCFKLLEPFLFWLLFKSVHAGGLCGSFAMLSDYFRN